MRATLALLLPLLVLALAHATEDLILRRNKDVYERGNDRFPWNPALNRHYYLANNQCVGVIQGNNIPCNKHVGVARLRVATDYDHLAPSIYISDKLDYAQVRRQGIREGHKVVCPGRLNVYLNVSCRYWDQ